MSKRNGFFQLLIKNDGTYLKLYDCQSGGYPIQYDEVSSYLIDNKLFEFDKIAIGKALSTLDGGTATVKISNARLYSHDELIKVMITEDRMRAVARFYPPTLQEDKIGDLLTQEEIVSSLVRAGVKYGADSERIKEFLENRQYCTDYVLAKALPASNGHDAEITYHFNTDLTRKPKTNDDGSVDFHQLDIISHCRKGDLLASLKPMDLGKPGIDVTGNVIRPIKVNNKVLHKGNRLRLSEDGLSLYADADGHVSLTDGKIFVSDTLEIPADVNTSTGDICYDGSVVIKGNVITGFSVRAKGDIEVHGVVEGAYIESEGQIILRRGMQGMNKGTLKAAGNIITKFIENAEVIAGGYITTESILHSRVSAKGDITVGGRRGFVTGGEIRSGCSITVKTAGSQMGTNTLLEVGIDPQISEEFREIERKIVQMQAEKERVGQTIALIRRKMQSGATLPADKLEQLRQITQANINIDMQIQEARKRYDELRLDMDGNVAGSIKISDTVYPGTKIVISSIIYFVRDTIQHSKFIRDRADIKVTPL